MLRIQPLKNFVLAKKFNKGMAKKSAGKKGESTVDTVIGTIEFRVVF